MNRLIAVGSRGTACPTIAMFATVPVTFPTWMAKGAVTPGAKVKRVSRLSSPVPRVALLESVTVATTVRWLRRTPAALRTAPIICRLPLLSVYGKYSTTCRAVPAAVAPAVSATGGEVGPGALVAVAGEATVSVAGAGGVGEAVGEAVGDRPALGPTIWARAL